MDVINVCIPGSLDGADSYGICAISLIRGLDSLGVGINVHALGNIDHANCPADVNALAHRPHRKAAGTFYLGYPVNVHRHPECTRHGPQMLLTMWESSIAPKEFIDPMNRMDAIITPSTFCKTVFRDSGVTSPVHTIPLGIGCLYQPYRRPEHIPLTFLAFLDRGARKGGLVAQQAFLRAFGDNPNYHLILKMREPKVVMNLLNENMTLIQRDMTEQELYELYCRADVLIDANKGEGFGLLPREFAKSGGISLSTDWGGTHDDIHAWGWPLRYKLVKADWAGLANLGGQDLGMWAELDPEDVAQKLRDVAEYYPDYIDAAWHKAQNARALYSWQRFAEQVRGVWGGLC